MILRCPSFVFRFCNVVVIELFSGEVMFMFLFVDGCARFDVEVVDPCTNLLITGCTPGVSPVMVTGRLQNLIVKNTN